MTHIDGLKMNFSFSKIIILVSVTAVLSSLVTVISTQGYISQVYASTIIGRVALPALTDWSATQLLVAAALLSVSCLAAVMTLIIVSVVSSIQDGVANSVTSLSREVEVMKTEEEDGYCFPYNFRSEDLC